MVGGENHQGFVEPHLLVNRGQKPGQRAVQAQDVFLGLEAGRAEQVTDVIGR